MIFQKRVLGAALLSLSLLGLGACSGMSGGGSTVIPLRAVGKVAGDMTGPQVFILDQTVNALIKVHGDFSYTVQPFPPYLTYDGNFQFLVEPLPGHEAEAIQAVDNGDLLIRRAGVPGALNAVGTIRAWKATMVANTLAREATAREAAADTVARDAAAKAAKDAADSSKVPDPASVNHPPCPVPPPSPVTVASELPEPSDGLSSGECPGGRCAPPQRCACIHLP